MMIVAVEKRFWENVDQCSSIWLCWEWKRYKNYKGYGIARYNASAVFAHRVAYKLTFGEVEEGKELDHLCENKACCNPYHLESVSPRENNRRYRKAKEGYCTKGHKMDSPIIDMNDRGYIVYRCRTCHNDRRRKK